ncbi:MAG: hypothetical protein H7195_04455 [Chryseobacterium sp.]|nr:hypothetical protein [Chryseobacterium sp.]
MKILSCFFLVFFFVKFTAQSNENLKSDQLYVEATVLSLKSTHRNYFNGATVFFGKDLTKKFNVAIGFEHSRNNFHNDNDWLLYKLRFNTIVVRQQILLFSEKKLKISADFREGLSFIKYVKEEPLVRKDFRYKVKEKGLFLYFGINSKLFLTQNIAIIVDLGIKGLHMSTNVYEVNPHGINAMTGLQVKL